RHTRSYGDWSSDVCSSDLGVLLNWYEGPGHYIGPHHDSVKLMIDGAPIVTVSFGETRIFRLTQGKGVEAKTLNFPATDGTVFVKIGRASCRERVEVAEVWV